MPESFEPSEPQLYMTELLLVDWSAGVQWYVEGLGLKPIKVDEPRRFALLGHPQGGKLAIKEAREFDLESPSRLRIIFQVGDLEATVRGLRSRGIHVGDITVNERESYREARLLDPEGTRITLFDWNTEQAKSQSG